MINAQAPALEGMGPGLRSAGALLLGALLLGTLLIGGLELLAMVVAGLLVLLVTVRFPGVLLAAYLGIAFHKGAIQPYSPVEITVLMSVLCTVQIIPAMLDRRSRKLSVSGMVLLSTLGIVVMLGVLYAPDQSLAFEQATTFLLLVWVPLIAIAIRVASREKFIRQFVYAFFALGVVAVVFGIVSPSQTQPLRVWGANTIQTARVVMVVPLLAMMFVPRIESLPVRLVVVGLSMAAVVVGLGTGSKGPLIALLLMGVVGSALYMASRGSSNSRSLVLITTGLAGVALALLVTGTIALPESAVLRFGIFVDFVQASIEGGAAVGSATDISSAVRIDLFTTAFRMFAESPVLGYGTAAFEAISPDRLGPVGAHRYPHNILLQFGAELGILGLAVLIGLIVLAFTRPIPVASYGHHVRVLFVFFLLGTMVTGNAFEVRVFWGLLMLLIFMEPRVDPGKEPESQGDDESDASYLVPTMGLRPSWVQNLAAAGWDWQRHYGTNREEPAPHALPPEGTAPQSRDRPGPPAGSR